MYPAKRRSYRLLPWNISSMRVDYIFGRVISEGASLALVFNMDTLENSSYGDLIWTVKLNRFCMEFVGIWPKTNKSTNNKYNFVFDLRMGITFVIYTLLTIPSVCSLIRVWGDMILMVENLQITVPLIIMSLQLIVMRWNRTAFLTIVNMMAEDWMVLKVNAEKNVMIKHTRIARLIGTCGYVILLFMLIVMIIPPSFGMPFRSISNVTDRKRLLPIQAYYFYDTDKSPQYELTFAAQFLTLSLGGLTYTSVDVFLGFAIFHLCAQLENFKHQLDNFVLWKDFNSALRNNVEIHIRLIRFVESIESLFTLTILGLILFFCLVFCIDGFLFVGMFSEEETINVSSIRICFIIMDTIVLLGHTFLYCGAGEIIGMQCEDVYDSMCKIDWYRMESTQAKNLILLITRASEPLRITAGKLFPLNMATFCSLLKTSAGYMSFLLAKHS